MPLFFPLDSIPAIAKQAVYTSKRFLDGPALCGQSSDVMKVSQTWTTVLLVLAIVAVATGCANLGSNNRNSLPRSLGIVGVTVAPGVEAGRTKLGLTREFQGLVQADAQFQVLDAESLISALNAATPGSYQTMTENYGQNGWLRGEDMRALFAARLPVENVLIARVEKNEVRPGAPKTIELFDSAGQVINDRERIVLSTIREMRLQASIINLASGSVVWSRAYRATPAADSSYIHYSGSSFSGSLAASFANTMTNGLRKPSGPKAPSSQQTLQSLMREVVRNLPAR